MSKDVGDIYFYLSMGIGVAFIALIIFSQITERFGVDRLDEAIQRELYAGFATPILIGDQDAHR